ncbi:hypothetical protein C4K09_2213 [Pseudomonas chlororaphis subsp. aureofaciens]|nr:hypothetical protein C4K13_2345 [Pseudomonas chlororaphis subsp. aureofaciens]AZE16674.1 hypothetical protein C4K09_2213 [Pseudomonas chlororaphis subsp. aureofaciens]
MGLLKWLFKAIDLGFLETWKTVCSAPLLDCFQDPFWRVISIVSRIENQI